MKVANTLIASESVAVGLRGKSVLPGDDELAMTDTLRQILRSSLAALIEGRVSEAVEQFADRFTFNDHALRLEFTDKTRLTKFLQKSRELFPDTILEISSLFESGDHAIAEWRFLATKSVPLGSSAIASQFRCKARRLYVSITGELSDGRNATTKARLYPLVWARFSQS